jgi:phosphoglycerate dehydrogenase-like enzyme
MQHKNPIILLSEVLTREQQEELSRVAPRARLVTLPELGSDPSLAQSIDICYSALPLELWDKAGGLSWLQTKWAGVDSILALPQVKAHPATITNVHIHGTAMAEHLWGMALMLTRNLKAAVIRQVEARWDESLRDGLANLSGKTLCVVGMGNIGASCAAVGKALGMRVVGIRRNPSTGRPSALSAGAQADIVVGPERRLEAFADARLIMMILPDTTETRAFVGKEELSVMKGAFLINGGRGHAIHTPALIDALRSGNVRGAGLDVTDPEPLPPSHPLWSAPNVIITPHYAGNHPGYDAEAFSVFLDNLGRWMRGEPLTNIVDRSKGY